MAKLKTIKIRTRLGVRSWEAENAAHACEQHLDAHAGQTGERVQAVIVGGRKIKRLPAICRRSK